MFVTSPLRATARRGIAAVVCAASLATLCVSPSVVAAAPPPVAAPPVNAIGGNADGIDYRGRTQMYVNLVRQAQPFMSMDNRSAPAAVDGAGWPLESFWVHLQTMGADLAGNYSVSIVDAGAALSAAPSTLAIVSAGDGAIMDQHDDPSTPGLVLATLVVTDVNATDIALNVSGVSQHGVQNLTVLLPGFERADVAPQGAVVAVDASGTDMPADVINPKYLQQLARFSTLRTLALSPFNRDFVGNWSSRATAANSPSWSNFCCPLSRSDASLPWEQLTDFANAIPGAPALWIILPLTADDEYYVNLATLMKQRLAQDTPLLLQYTNELWNGGFESEHVLRQWANTSVLHDGDPYHLNYDGVDNDIIWGARLAAYQASVRVPALFGQVFGTESVGPAPRKVRPLLAGQTSYAKWMSDQLSYLATQQPGAIDNIASAAIAYYFNLQRKDSTSNTLTGPQVLTSLSESLAGMAPNLTTQWAAHAALAVWYGLPEVRGYECGPATFGALSIPGKVEANEAPGMGTLIETMYAQWHQHAHSFGELNIWHAGMQDYNWPYGQWTLGWRWDVPETPKTRALDAVRGKPRPAPTLGAVVPFTNHSASHYVGYYASSSRPTPPDIQYVVVNATFQYLVQVPTAGVYEVVVHTGTRNTSVAPDCFLTVQLADATHAGYKGTAQRVALPPTNSTHEFMPTKPVMWQVDKAGDAVVQLQAVPTGMCVHVSGTNQVAWFAIGGLDVVRSTQHAIDR